MTTKKWGAGLSPRGALAPPSARPSKLLRQCDQSCLHRIPFDVPPDAPKLIANPHNPIKILLLPKLHPVPSQQPVSQASSRTLNPSENLRQRNDWSAQKVHMIGHDHEGMQGTKTASVGLVQLFLNHTGDLHLPQIEWTTSSRVEKPVPGDECLAGTQVFALEDAPWRKASPKPPSDKRRYPRHIDMRQAAAITSHTLWCAAAAVILKQACGAEAPRGLKPALH